jgi:hypothetical protein
MLTWTVTLRLDLNYIWISLLGKLFQCGGIYVEAWLTLNTTGSEDEYYNRKAKFLII